MKRILWLGLVLAGAVPVEAQVGRYSSVAIGTDGLALISYYDATNGVLKVAHCSDLACTLARITSLDVSLGGTFVAIGGDGLGLIVHGAGGVRVAHCADLPCRGATTASIYVNGINDFYGASGLAIGADGRGFITVRSSHIRSGFSALSAAHCSNPACSSITGTVLATASLSEGLPGGVVAVGSDGRPLIGYSRRIIFPVPGSRLFAGHCQDAVCTAFGSSADVGAGSLPLAMAMGSDGLGLMAWTDVGAGLGLVHCGDAACGGATIAVLDPAGPIQDAAVAAGSDGLPLVAYVSGNDLKVAHCNDPACTSASVTVLDGPSQVTDNGLAIGADGLGLISYHDAAAGVLKVAHCENVACTSATITLPSAQGPFAADLSVQLSHFPEPVTGLQTLTYRLVTRNLGPDDASGVNVTLPLPPGAVFQSYSGSGWSCGEAGGTVTCSRGTYVLAMPEILVRVTAPPTAQVLSATATISSLVADPQLENNTDTETVTVTAAPLAELAVAMSDGGAVVHPGQPFTWTITVSNVGATDVSGATVMDMFPATVTGVTWMCAASTGATCPPGGAGGIFAPVNLPMAALAIFTASGTLSPSAYVLSNTATITPPPGHYDPNLADNSVTVASQPEPTQAYTLVPCRVMDTRVTPPALEANTTRTFTVTGTCAVPADARALMVNATAVAPGDRGNLRLYPTGATAPLASSLNFAPGRTRANNAVVPLGTDGQISVQCDMPSGSTATTHFLLDVYGYFK